MFGSSGVTGTLVRRTFVAVQIFLLIAMLFAPLPAAAADPSLDPGASGPPSAAPSASPEPTVELAAEPSAEPPAEPTAEPTAEPPAEPTPAASDPAGTPDPTAEPAAPVSSPTIGSDLDDYPPGGHVTLTGGGWQPGESVHIFVNDDWGSSWSRTVDVSADADGRIVDQFDLPNWFVAEYSVAARGEHSGVVTTTFTDSQPGSATVAAPTTRSVVQGSAASYGNLAIVQNGNTSTCTLTLGASGLPSGATAQFGANPLVMTSENVSTSVSVSTTATTPTGTYPFTISALKGGDCQGPAGSVVSNPLSLTVTANVVTTATGVASSTNPSTFGSAVTFTATVTGSTSPNGAGSVTFSDGASVICANVALTSNTAQCVTSALSATASPHSISAAYSGATGFTASTSATILQAITPKGVVITPDGGQGKVYGTSDPTRTFANDGGLAAGAFTGSLGRAAGEDVGTYAIDLGSLSAGGNYNLSLASATVLFAITEAPLTVDFVAAGKVYDTTTDASITSCTVSPVLGLDDVDCDASGATASFASADAGSHIVSGSGFGLTGADAANYAITLVHTTSATIAQAGSVTAVTCPVSVVYSGLAQTPCEVSVIGAGGLELSPAATYGANIGVGTASAEYSFAGDTNHTASFDSASFDITPAPLTVDFVAAGKVYDTTTDATITSCTVATFLLDDDVSCDASGATATFASADAGTRAVTASGFGLTGDDAANYEIIGVTPTSAAISKAPSMVTVDCTAGAPFTFSGVAQTPCTAEATGIGLAPIDVTGSLIYGDNLHAGTATADAAWPGDANHDGDTGSSTFDIARASSSTSVGFEAGPYVYRGTPFTATAHVTGVGGLSESVNVDYSGDCTNVTLGGCTASATFAGDADHTGSMDSHSIAITRKSVTGAFTAANKVWDGTTDATVVTTSVVGKVAGDDVALTGGSASLSSSMVGTWTVTLSGAALSGSAAGNYVLGTIATTTATISTAFRIVGFDAPVEMTTSGQERNYNSVKNGQTVPLKFRVFNLDGSEVVATSGLTAWARNVSCATGDVDPTLLPIVSTADTGLRRTGDRFQFNWFVPKGAGKCYQVVIQTVDGSTVMVGAVGGTPVVEAYFRSK